MVQIDGWMARSIDRIIGYVSQISVVSDRYPLPRISRGKDTVTEQSIFEKFMMGK